jgi:uncharacterized protein
MALLSVVPALTASCASSAPVASRSRGGPVTVTWVDEDVSFRTGGLTIYATFRHPVGDDAQVPGVLLIAGSGPTDRDGNSPLEPGRVDTLKTVADWLSSDGVASLRYDKLGSGETGLGPYAANPDSIGMAPFEEESLAALKFLAAQKGIDDRLLGVIGHSEGALYALLLATGHAGDAPPIRALGLLEPLSLRYLDVITIQVEAQISAQLESGQITAEIAHVARTQLTEAVDQIRENGTVPSGLGYGLPNLFNKSTALYLDEADKFDPEMLAGSLPAGMPVLVTCSNADQQVSCSEVDHLVAGLTTAQTATDFVHLVGVDHVLKEDPTGSPANYTKPLPFSTQLESALKMFVAAHL